MVEHLRPDIFNYAKSYHIGLIFEAEGYRALTEAGVDLRFRTEIMEVLGDLRKLSTVPSLALIHGMNTLNDLTKVQMRTDPTAIKQLVRNPAAMFVAGTITCALFYLIPRAVGDFFDPHGARLRREDRIIAPAESRSLAINTIGGGIVGLVVSMIYNWQTGR